MLIGATMTEADLPTFKVMLAGNNIMRVFPVGRVIAGRTMRVLPPWDDSRFVYCRVNNTIPFVSTKVDGDPDGIAFVRTQLMALPPWVRELYITDRHEPEADVTAEQFRANFTAFLAMVDTLPASLRSRIRCGPVLTKNWTERAGRTYDTYDPGTGDFFGSDMYVATGSATAVVSPATLPTAKDFIRQFRGYRKSPADTRPRLWPEFGAVGMPDDPDGTGRAAFITAVYEETKTWTPELTGWQWLGFIWWHAPGKATGKVFKVGQRRDFPLHLRTVDDQHAEALPGDPPAPVAAYNAAWREQNPAPAPEPTPVPAPAPAPVQPPAGPEPLKITGVLAAGAVPGTVGPVAFHGLLWLDTPPAGGGT